jgi:hypothetical protein
MIQTVGSIRSLSVTIQHKPRTAANSLMVAVSGVNIGGKDVTVELTRMYSQRFPEEIARYQRRLR